MDHLWFLRRVYLLLPPRPASAHSVLRSRGSTVAGFLLQLELYMATVRPTPSVEESAIVLVFCLTGHALEWANAVWNSPNSAKEHYPEFTRRFSAIFAHPPEGRAAGERLFHLRQETRSVQDFALELAAGAGWNDRPTRLVLSVLKCLQLSSAIQDAKLH